MRRILSSIVLHTGLLVLLAPLALGQHEDHPDHEPLQKDAGLSFADVLHAAVLQAPLSLETPVRAQQAEDQRVAARSWIAGRPALVFSINDDGPLDNAGLQEQEYGLQLPLWRLGEMQANRQLGERYSQQVEAWNSYLQWQLAGELRIVLAEIEAAEVALELEQQATATAAELQAVTEKLLAAGAVARLDLLQVENLLLRQQTALLDAEARLVDAERTYSLLTGLQQRPASPHREALYAEEEITDTHPALVYLQSEVGVAESGVRHSEMITKGSPQLTIGSRRERGDRLQPYTDSVGVSVNIPIGGKSIVAARTSAARREQANAEVALLTARRNLQSSLHEAEHELYVTRQSLPLVEQQAALGEQRRSMAQAAYAAGEITLAQVLTATQEAALATYDLHMLQLQEQQLITEYNQFVGVMP